MAEEKIDVLLLRCLVNRRERISGCCCLDDVTGDNLLFTLCVFTEVAVPFYTQRDP